MHKYRIIITFIAIRNAIFNDDSLFVVVCNPIELKKIRIIKDTYKMRFYSNHDAR